MLSPIKLGTSLGTSLSASGLGRRAYGALEFSTGKDLHGGRRERLSGAHPGSVVHRRGVEGARLLLELGDSARREVAPQI